MRQRREDCPLCCDGWVLIVQPKRELGEPTNPQWEDPDPKTFYPVGMRPCPACNGRGALMVSTV